MMEMEEQGRLYFKDPLKEFIRKSRFYHIKVMSLADS